MTNAELIEKLKKLPLDWEVIYHPCDAPIDGKIIRVGQQPKYKLIKLTDGKGK